ncbi:MAG: zinc ribbon domain-containing protein [Chloroflexota bacterium]
MPVYDYVCSSCGHRFEVFRGLNESGPRQCPLCEGPVSRAFAPPTIHFKGSGWAKMDRRSPRTPSKKAAGSQANDSGSHTGESKSALSDSGESKSTGSDSGESKSARSHSGESTSPGSRSGKSKSAGSSSPSSDSGD